MVTCEVSKSRPLWRRPARVGGRWSQEPTQYHDTVYEIERLRVYYALRYLDSSRFIPSYIHVYTPLLHPTDPHRGRLTEHPDLTPWCMLGIAKQTARHLAFPYVFSACILHMSATIASDASLFEPIHAEPRLTYDGQALSRRVGMGTMETPMPRRQHRQQAEAAHLSILRTAQVSEPEPNLELRKASWRTSSHQLNTRAQHHRERRGTFSQYLPNHQKIPHRATRDSIPWKESLSKHNGQRSCRRTVQRAS